MIIKTLGGVGVLMGGIAWLAGAFNSSYSREVGRPMPEVIAALSDLDITQQPGSPGTDPSRSGGVKALIKLDKSANMLTWTVMSGDKVATRMIAHLEPVDGGAHTKVTTEVERGDAPDDVVSPAFRSEGITMGLFGMALEGELNKLTGPPLASKEACRAHFAELMGVNDGPMRQQPEPANLTQAIGRTAKDSMRLAAIQDELRRRGCPMDGSVDYSEPDGGTPPPPPSMSHADGLQDASKPMMEAAPTLNVLPQ